MCSACLALACTPSLDLSAQLTWTEIGTRRAVFAQLSAAGQSESQEGSTEQDKEGGVNNVLSFLWPQNLDAQVRVTHHPWSHSTVGIDILMITALLISPSRPSFPSYKSKHHVALT